MNVAGMPARGTHAGPRRTSHDAMSGTVKAGSSGSLESSCTALLRFGGRRQRMHAKTAHVASPSVAISLTAIARVRVHGARHRMKSGGVGSAARRCVPGTAEVRRNGLSPPSASRSTFRCVTNRRCRHRRCVARYFFLAAAPGVGAHALYMRIIRAAQASIVRNPTSTAAWQQLRPTTAGERGLRATRSALRATASASMSAGGRATRMSRAARQRHETGHRSPGRKSARETPPR